MNHFCLTIITILETMLVPFMLEIFFQSLAGVINLWHVNRYGIAISFLSCYHCKFPLCDAHACNFFGLRPKTTPAEWKTQSLPAFIFRLLIGIFSTFAFLFTERYLGRLFSTVKKLDSMSIYFPFYVHLCMPHRQLRVF